MHVQRLVASDVERYRELMLHAYAVAPEAFTSTPEERSAEPISFWLDRIDHPNGLSSVFGAFHNDQLIGAVAVAYSAKPKTRHKARLVGTFVRESCRGLGAGGELVGTALEAAKTRPEVQVIMLTVTEGNAPAVHLYERHGFRQFGIEPMAVATADGFKAKIHMWVRLERGT